MVLRAVPLIIQLRVFTRTARPDGSWKVIRAAYIWFLVALIMIPLLMPYSSWM
jgi:hypothetical protein